jgi:hypothetical protein
MRRPVSRSGGTGTLNPRGVSPIADRLGALRKSAAFGPTTAIGLGLSIAGLIALCAVSAWPAGSMVAAQPGATATGDLEWLRVFAIAQTLALALFLAAVAIIRWRPPAIRQVLVLAMIIQLLPLAAPLMLSTDAYSYWNAGRLAVGGANPYEFAPADVQDDPSLPYVPDEWRDETTKYGPAFTSISQAVAVAAGDDAALAAGLFRVLAGGLMVALAFLVSRVAPHPAFAAAFVGWNPVFAIQFAGSGHNDVLMVTLVVVGLVALSRRRTLAAGASWAVAVFVKWTPLILVPLQVLEDRSRGRPSIGPSLVVATAILATVSTAAFGWSWLGTWLSIVNTAGSDELNSLAIWPRIGSGLPGFVVKAGPLVVFAAAYLLLLRQASRGRARRGLAMGLFLIASPFLWTWYVIAPAALAAIEDDVPALWIAIGLCVYTGMYLGVGGGVIRVVFG